MRLLGTTRSWSSHLTASRPVRRGFTVVEVVVVIAIIGVLTSLILPAVMPRRTGRLAVRWLGQRQQVCAPVGSHGIRLKQRVTGAGVKAQRGPDSPMRRLWRQPHLGCHTPSNHLLHRLRKPRRHASKKFPKKIWNFC